MEYAKLGLAKLRRQQAGSLHGSHDPYLAARFVRQEKAFKERLARLERKAPLFSPARRRAARGVAEPKANPELW